MCSLMRIPALAVAWLALAALLPVAAPAQQVPKASVYNARDATILGSTVMGAACETTDRTLCLSKATEAVAVAKPVQAVILLGCLAELSASGDQGAKVIESAKTRANNCLEQAVSIAALLPESALVVGQGAAATPNSVVQSLPLPALASSVKSSLLAANEKCGRIRHMYTRYNCFTKRLYQLLQAP